MSFNVTLRVIGMALFAAAGLLLGLYVDQLASNGAKGQYFDQLVLPLIIISALFGFVATPYVTVYPVRWLRSRLKTMPALDLMASACGLSVGLVLGALFTWPLSNLPGWLGDVAPTLVTLLFAGLGIYVAVLRRRDFLDLVQISAERSGEARAKASATTPRIETISGPAN